SADQPSAEPAGTDVADAESLDDGVADETDSPVDPSEQSVNSDEEQVDVALPAFHDEAVEPSEAAGFDAASSDDAESDAAESNAAESNAAESDAVEPGAAAHVEAIAELEWVDETEPESDLIPEPAPEAEPQPQPQPQPDPELESEPEPEPDVEPTAAETPAQELIAPVQSAAWDAQPSAAPALASKWGTEDWSPRTQRPGPRDPREIVRPIPAFLNRRVPVDSDVPPAPRIQAPTPPVDAGAIEPAPLVQPAFTRPPAIEPVTTNDPEFTTDVDSTRVVQRGSGGERFVLQFSTGESVMVFGSGLLGRNPMAQPGEEFEQTLAISDPSKSVSKTHLEFGQSQGSFWVLDRFSANGTVVREPETAPRRCEPGRRYQVVRGTRVDIGEQFFIVS
ncbi:MAG: hypothetical protein JWQ43_2976, partial [Glaciihabitans sp.]|nr:hypothetical protein [Glaciihabitans sp.]